MGIVDLNSLKCPACGSTGTMMIAIIRALKLGIYPGEVAICYKCGYAIDPMGRSVAVPELVKAMLMLLHNYGAIGEHRPKSFLPGLQDVLDGKLGPINIKEDNPDARL